MKTRRNRTHALRTPLPPPAEVGASGSLRHNYKRHGKTTLFALRSAEPGFRPSRDQLRSVDAVDHDANADSGTNADEDERFAGLLLTLRGEA